ncbi:MAG: exodeoxyribonuclease V beta subunit [Desulforhopalus sp.]|jgi:exodeoxyribonuclease V beta subunit
MADDIIVFDAARVPFVRGTSLVEASAGTGKTYAIGMLVLRGIVELGIPIEKILIVTFTKAATEELKSRIRSRLVEARDLLQDRLEPESQKKSAQVDATLVDWVATLSDFTLAIQRLQLALYDIDNASIFTIHGFCQRMLVDQALESGQLFNVELVTNIDHMITQVVDDFWRNEIYPLAPLPCAIVTAAFDTPEKLLASVSVAYRSVGEIQPQAEPADKAIAVFQATMASLQGWWREGRAELYTMFSEAVANKHFKKWLCDNFEHWFSSIDAFLEGTTYLVPENIEFLMDENLLGELNGTKFRGDEKKNNYIAEWSLPTREVAAFCLAKEALLLSYRCALASLRSEVSERLLVQGTMGFDGLIQNLAAGLDGDKGRQLKEVIGQRFSLALIDEFQDTDSLQYKIFSELFGGGKHHLYLIGDPKQAIYKFRGADIHSYFHARNSADKRLTLEKNYRSHPLLVEEVNRLFENRSRPFLYDETMLDYNRVSPGLSDSNFDIVQRGESLAGMVYCSLPENSEDKNGRWSSGKAADVFLGYTVGEISGLLTSSSRARYHINEVERELAPGDIAILVRSHKQAEKYQASLIEAGIPAVVSSRNSVFRTVECWQLIVLLKAMASPTEISKLKSAMTISWFQLTGNMLLDIWQDEEQLSIWQGKMILYHGIWQDYGLFSMMNSFIQEEKILTNIAGTDCAERAIANLYQLIELVQDQESSENYGMGQVLQWLQRMYQQESSVAGAELLLESDEDAVQIVTMHGAKGLEYPVVFCPYLWYSSNRISSEKYQVSVHENGQNVIDLGSDSFKERKLQAERDQKAEDLRLLYVALTRAKVRCYTMWGDVKKHTSVADSFDSALGYLMFAGGPCDGDAQASAFAGLVATTPIKHCQIHDVVVAEKYELNKDYGDLSPLSPSTRSLKTDWQMSSFSGLATLSDYEYDHGGSKGRVAGENPIAVPGLPAGANFGNVIHDLLEELDFSSIQSSPEISSLIERKCERFGVDAHVEDIEKLLSCVVSSCLAGDFCLMDLPKEHCLKEMPFYFQLSLFQTSAIGDILKSDPTVLPVGPRQMRGYLTGFVDLICLENGKYYIMDYKTNNLGGDLSAYQHDQLVLAMKSHNYGLQYWIYSLVLHLHLQNLIEDYSYESHFGGVMYLFVRGMSPDYPGSGVFSTIPDYETLLRLAALLGESDDDE